MINWIKTSKRLPPFRKRVLIWTNSSNLMDWDGKFVQAYIMERIPQATYGNHRVPYSWQCENSGWEYGHTVTHWAEIEPPNE
jgi:hypothetical protein